MVEQEFWGLLMYEAAVKANEDPDRLSFVHSVRIVQRRLAHYIAIPLRQRKALHEAVLDEIFDERANSSRHRINFRGVKRKMGSGSV